MFGKCSFLHNFDDISLEGLEGLEGLEITQVNNVLKLNLSKILLFSIYKGNTKKPVF